MIGRKRSRYLLTCHVVFIDLDLRVNQTIVWSLMTAQRTERTVAAAAMKKLCGPPSSEIARIHRSNSQQ